MSQMLTQPIGPAGIEHASAASKHPRVRHESLPTTNGRLGMWIFLGSEVVTFGGVVAAYVMLRLTHPEWLKHSSQTLLPVGAINTVVLLTSSLTMVLAHNASELYDTVMTRKWLLLTMLLGLMFMALKGYEYTHEITHGRTPAAGIFWGFYYVMTGLHGLHVLAGLVLMAYLWRAIGRGHRLTAVAPAGLYWHFVDIVWIFLFPLLYVTSHV